MTQKLSEQAKQNKKLYNINYGMRLINCDCGGKTIYAHLSRHNKTKKHLNYISIKDNLNV
jgi:hypothetical protein